MPDTAATTEAAHVEVEPPATDRWQVWAWGWPLLWATATGVVLFLLARPAGIVEDDLLNLQLHKDVGSLADLLLAPVLLTQVAPGHQALTALQLWIGPTDDVVMHALMAALAGATVLVGARIVTRLVGARRWVPVALALAIGGPSGLAIMLWYAAAYHFIPALLFGLLGVLAYARWRRWQEQEAMPDGFPLLAVLLIGVGLLFSLKAALAVVFILLLEYVLLRHGDLETIVVGLWKDRRVWLAFAVLLAAYLALTQRSGLDPAVGTAGSIVAAVLQGIVRMTGPMLVGLGNVEPNYTLPDLPLEVVGGIWIAILVVAVLIARRGRIAQRGLVVGAALHLTSMVISTAPRTTFLGEAAGLAPRYHYEGLVYIVLSVALGLALQRQADLAAATTPPRPPARWWVVLRPALAVLVVVALLGSTGWSHQRQLDESFAIASGSWIRTLEQSLAAAPDSTRVLEGPIPPFVLSLVTGSRMDRLDGLVPGLDVAHTAPNAVVTAAGEVEPLQTAELFAQRGADFVTNPLVQLTGDVLPFDGEACTTSEFTTSIPLAPHDEPRVIEIAMRGPATVGVTQVARLGFANEPGSGDSWTDGEDVRAVVLPMDLHGWAAAVDVVFRAGTGAPACLLDIRFLEVTNDLPDDDPANHVPADG